MVKVFARVPGAAIRIDGFGVATTDAPVELPAEVAAALPSDEFRVEEPAKPQAPAATKKRGGEPREE